MKLCVTMAACLTFALAAVAFPGERLVVHEWGTFTSYQNEQGEALRRINTDDEPVPAFVHQLVRQPPGVRLFSPTDFSLSPGKEAKGIRGADHRVTMRLETPVVYFHLPAGVKSQTLDVEVGFRRGFLTQYFPQAEALVNGKLIDSNRFPEAKALLSSLRWSGVRVGDAGPLPETAEHVWLAPRQVAADSVTVGSESERYLFYRGVGELESPLTVMRHADQILDVRLNRESLQELVTPTSPIILTKSGGKDAPSLTTRQVWENVAAQRLWWLLEVRPDGTAAYRRLPSLQHNATEPDRLCLVSGVFPERDFSKQKLADLRAEMQEALVGDGLFADEAAALLNTWQLSYFLSPGQRLFYLAPREWTDAVLPLQLSVPADVDRVMVGRIELVTPRQRELIREMAATPVPDLTELLERMHTLQKDPNRREDYNALASGRGDSSILGVPVPANYQAFLDLGRFRTSLLLDTLARDRQSEAGQFDRVMQFQFELLYPGVMQRE